MSHKPSPREFLEVIAFFPQGINENNLDWLFPTVPDRQKIIDQFCIFSLTYRSDGFIRMLAPIRDYLSPQDPKSSPLLRETKKRYFHRLSVEVGPNLPGFEKAEWIGSEAVNVEHLLDVFTSIDPKAGGVWTACYHFMQHVKWYKPRLTVLGPKIKALPDSHSSKVKCLIELSQLFSQVGNHAEEKRVLTHTLTLVKLEEDEALIAQILRMLSCVNRVLGLHEEGIRQAKEAVKISEQLGDKISLATTLESFASSLFRANQLVAAEAAASRALDLALGKDQYLVCKSHRLLGQIYHQKHEREKAFFHFETALEIASPSNWLHDLFWIHYSLATVFLDESEFGKANSHIERAKSHVVNHPYYTCFAMEKHVLIWYRQGRFEEATFEALRAIESFEKLGLTWGVERCKGLLREIERAMESKHTPADPDREGELLQTMLSATAINTLFSTRCIT